MNFCVKVHKTSEEVLVAICDKDILGKEFTYKEVKLKVHERFYGLDEYSANEVLTEISRCTSLNAFGKEICQFLVEKEIVHPATIMWIEHNGEQIGHVILVK